MAPFLMVVSISAIACADVEISVSPQTSLYDEKVAIRVEGLPPGEETRLELSWSAEGSRWSSWAAFVADDRGIVDLTTTSAQSGSYLGLDPMGLFWSAEKTRIDSPKPAPRKRGSPQPPWDMSLHALVGGKTKATTTLTRKLQTDGLQGHQVEEDGLVGVFFMPPLETPVPALLVLPGSGAIPPEITARAFADHGYACLGLAYFRMRGLPSELNEIPLEYFLSAIQWLRKQPGVDPHRVGIVGKSRGGEVALVLGAIYPEIKAVVAYAPSHVVWPGTGRNTSSWSYKGQPIAFVSWPANLSAMKEFIPKPLFNQTMCWAAFENHLSVARATIPAERINGGILLITGKDDQVWPSSYMADQVIKRLQRFNFSHPYQHLAYDHVGHSVLWPYLPTKTPEIDPSTAAAIAKAWEDAWRQVLAFLEKVL